MQSNDLRKRGGGGGGYSTGSPAGGGGPPRPQPPPRGPGVVGYSPQPPPPPFGGNGRAGGTANYSPQQAHRPQAMQAPQQLHYGGGTATPSQYHNNGHTTTTASPSRPAYNYAAPAGGYGGYSGSGTGGGASNGGSYGGYTGGSNAVGAGSGYAFANGKNNTSEDNKYSKKKMKVSRGNDAGTIVLGVGLVFTIVYGLVMTILFLSYRGKTNAMLSELEQGSVQAVIDHAQELKHRLASTERQLNRAKQETSRTETQKIATLQKENRLLQKETEDLKRKYESREANQVQTKLKERDMAFSEQVQWLMAVTRRESKRTVLERFGPGPHQVEITFATGTYEGDNDTRARYSFVVELAPLDAVPHAIHLFLEQVEHGLLSGTWFYLNGPHILQAGPQLEEEDPEYEYDHTKKFDSDFKITNLDGDLLHVAAAKSLKAYSAAASGDEEDDYATEDRRMTKFAQLGLDKLAFPDYSHDFPHQPWTLGYTGRPGGPDWYINKVDNTKGHGPGGQHQHALSEQGDSCFGRVVQGQGRDNLAKHLFGAPIFQDRSEWHYFLKDPVEIVGAKILTKRPEVVNINMGTPLHRGDFIKRNGGRTESSDQPFGVTLETALKEPGMNPAESDPDHAAKSSESRVETKEEVASEETNKETQQTLNAQESSQEGPRVKVKRKPRIPKIDGAAEA